MVEGVRVERSHDGAVRTIVLDRHQKRNALSPHILEAIGEAFTSEPDERERVTLIRAEGTVFCAGIDLSERIQNGWPVESPLVRVLDRIRTYPFPVVAAMQGDAIAGGAMLLMHCDLIVAAHGARLVMPLAQLGIAPPYIVSSRIVDRVGPALARELLFLGDPVPVERLLAVNAINAVVNREQLMPTVGRMLDRLARNAPLSLRAVKTALSIIGDAQAPTPPVEAERLTRLALDSTDAKEGMKARLEKRTPVFTGR